VNKMEQQPKKIPIVSDGEIFDANPEDLESFIDLGWQVAKPEDIEFYTSTTQAILGVGEAFGRGTIPGFTAAQIALGAEPERIKKREEISVGKPLSTAIEVGSLILPGMAISKAASLAAKGAEIPNYLNRLATASKFTLGGASEIAGSAAAAGIEGSVARLATKYGIENAVFGAADEVDKILLSDEPQDALQNAQNVAVGAGLSFLVGAGVGAGVGKVSELWKARKGGKTQRLLEQARKDADNLTSTEELLKQTGLAPDVPQAAPGPESIKSTQDLIDFVEGLPPVQEVPREGRKIVEEATQRLRDQNKLKYAPHEADLKALENKQFNDTLQTVIERGDKTAAAQIQHLQYLKKTMVDGLSDEIKTIAPTPVANKLDAGRKFLDMTRNMINDWSNQLNKKFKTFSNVAINKLDDVTMLSANIETKFPGMTEFLQLSPEGALVLKPYESRMPISKLTHQALKDVARQISAPNLTIQGLWNVRKNVVNTLEEAKAPETRKQLYELQKSLFDVLSENVSKIDPSIDTKNLFKEYSNLKAAEETLEDILGGKLSADSYRTGEIIPEDVLKNLMSNSSAMGAAKSILGERWNTVLADIMEVAKEGATDKTSGVFSSANFKRFIEAKLPQLTVGFEGQENKLKNIIDFNTVMRAVPDKMPANPSRSAPTAFELGKQLLGRGTLNPASAFDKAADFALLKIDEQMTKQGFDSLFKDKAAKPGVGMYRFLESAKNVSATAFEAMQEFVKQSAKGAYLTKDAIKSIFVEDKPSPVKTPSERSLQSLDKKLMQMEQSMEEILESGGDVGYYMPEQDTALGVINSRVIGYLATQRPGVKQSGILNDERLPTKPEMQKYYRTLQIAERPAMVLKRIKEGSLISKDIQDIQAMYPETYNYFLNNLTEEIVDRKTEKQPIPFRTRKSLSLFCGLPLDTTLTPQAIQAAQSTYAPKNLPAPQTPQFAPKSGRKSQMPSLTETEQQRRMRQ